MSHIRQVGGEVMAGRLTLKKSKSGLLPADTNLRPLNKPTAAICQQSRLSIWKVLLAEQSRNNNLVSACKMYLSSQIRSEHLAQQLDVVRPWREGHAAA